MTHGTTFRQHVCILIALTRKTNLKQAYLNQVMAIFCQIDGFNMRYSPVGYPVDWPYTKTFIEGIVYYFELLFPFHATANVYQFIANEW